MTGSRMKRATPATKSIAHGRLHWDRRRRSRRLVRRQGSQGGRRVQHVPARRGPQVRQRVDDDRRQARRKSGSPDDAAKSIIAHRNGPDGDSRHRGRRHLRRPRRARSRSTSSATSRSASSSYAIVPRCENDLDNRPFIDDQTFTGPSGGWARDNAEVESVLGVQGITGQQLRALLLTTNGSGRTLYERLRRNRSDGGVHVRLRARRDAVGQRRPGRARADAAGRADDRVRALRAQRRGRARAVARHRPDGRHLLRHARVLAARQRDRAARPRALGQRDHGAPAADRREVRHRDRRRGQQGQHQGRHPHRQRHDAPADARQRRPPRQDALERRRRRRRSRSAASTSS